MRILRLRLRNYRGVREHEVVFAPHGVTVVQGDNEVGKSSLAEALDVLFDYRDDSTHRAIKAIRPAHRDAGAEVEVEVEAGPYRFTYAKRFHRDRFTTLRVTEPRPENFIGREAHERANAILEASVDVPLWKALRLQQGVRPDQADLSEQTSLAAALDAAAAGALAGEREATLVEVVRAEYERFHTPKGSLKIEVTALGNAEADAARRADDVRRTLAELDNDIARCESLTTTIATLSQEVADQRQRVRQYEDQWKEVEVLVQEAEKARLGAALAIERRTGAEAEVARRLDLVGEVTAAAQAEAAAREQRDLSAPALAAASQAVAGAEERAKEADDRARAASTNLRAGQAAFTLHRDRHDLATLRERLDRVRATQAELAAFDVLLDGNRVDEEALARIEDAHLALAQAQARADAARPVVTVEALRPVTVDGTTLAAGDVAVRPVAADAAVVIDDVARITVAAGGQATDEHHTRAHAAEVLAGALQQAGVRDLAEARAAATARRDAVRSIEHLTSALRADLRDLTPERMQAKVDRLVDRVAAAGGAAPGPAPADFDTARQLVETAEQELARAEADAVDARLALGQRQAELSRVEQQAEVLERQVVRATQRLDAAREALGAERAARADADLHDRLYEATEEARLASARLTAAAEKAERARPEELRQVRTNALSVLDKLEAERTGAEREHDAVRARLTFWGEEGLHDKLAEAEADLEHRRRERRRTEAKAAAARRLYDTLVRCRADARQAYVTPLRSKIESLGRIVFGESLSIELDDHLRIARRTLDGVTLDFEQLSTGAREQLCVLSRLACAALVADEDGGVPVILDDALGWSDAKRLERLGAAFNVAVQDAQVIVLTCMPERYRHIGSATFVRLGGSPERAAVGY